MISIDWLELWEIVQFVITAILTGGLIGGVIVIPLYILSERGHYWWAVISTVTNLIILVTIGIACKSGVITWVA